MNCDTRAAPLRRKAWPQGLLAVLAGTTLLAAAACGGSGSHQAGPGTSPVGLTAQKVDMYAQCMRSHGMANFYLSRPGSSTGSSSNDAISFGPFGVVLGVDTGSPQYASADTAGQHLLPHALAPKLTAAQLHQLVQAAGCMRARGYPGYPDPKVQDGRLVNAPLPPSIDINSPQFQAARKTCHPAF